MNTLISPATEVCALAIVPLLADRDRAEMVSFGLTGERQAALVRASKVSWCAMRDGVPTWLGGVVPSVSREGHLWMLTTPEIREHTRWIVRQRDLIRSLVQTAFDVVWGAVDMNHPLTTRWLRWAGFSFLPPREIEAPGAGMVMVHPCCWRRT